VIAGKLPASIFPKTDSDRIVLTGYIDDETLRSLYSLSTAFVFPTLAEGFGLPALEAMSCGTAVICSGGSSLVEVVNNPQAYFDPYSIESIAAKMKQVIEDPEFRAELISKGTEQAKQFSWASSAEKALIFLEQVRERYPQTDVSSPDPVDCLIKQIAVLKRRPTEQELFALTRAITLRA
jgi:glycosyltransferase involved in cell wall biosynthesis